MFFGYRKQCSLNTALYGFGFLWYVDPKHPEPNTKCHTLQLRNSHNLLQLFAVGLVLRFDDPSCQTIYPTTTTPHIIVLSKWTSIEFNNNPHSQSAVLPTSHLYTFSRINQVHISLGTIAHTSFEARELPICFDTPTSSIPRHPNTNAIVVKQKQRTI